MPPSKAPSASRREPWAERDRVRVSKRLASKQAPLNGQGLAARLAMRQGDRETHRRQHAARRSNLSNLYDTLDWDFVCLKEPFCVYEPAEDSALLATQGGDPVSKQPGCRSGFRLIFRPYIKHNDGKGIYNPSYGLMACVIWLKQWHAVGVTQRTAARIDAPAASFSASLLVFPMVAAIAGMCGWTSILAGTAQAEK